MSGKSVRSQPFLRRLGCNGFGAVLTELSHVSLAIRVGPRATGTVEPVLLVHLQERLKTPPGAHFLEADIGCRVNGWQARRRGLPGRYLRALLLEWRLRPLDSQCRR